MRRVVLAGLLFFLAASGYAQNTYPPLIRTVTYAGLGTSANNGTIRYCRDCDATSPCAGSGVGAFALRVNGAWECTSSGGAGSLTSSDGSIVILGSDLTVDDSAFKRYLTGTGAAPGTCTPGTDYIRTDTNEFFPCTSTNVFVQAVTHQQDSIAGADWFIDEDSFATNSATRVPSQQSVKAYVDASGGGGTTSDVTKGVFVDEFANGLATTGNIGNLGWSLALSGAAGTVAQGGGPTANHPGILAMASGATDNAGPYVSNVLLASGDYNGEDWEMIWIIAPEDAVTSTYLAVGLGAAEPIAASSAIRAVFDSDHAHATWIFQICDSATTGCQSAGDDTNSDTHASTKAPAAGVWQRIRIRRATAGVGGNPTVYFSVGDTAAMETEITFCASGCDSTFANMPTATLATRIGIAARAAATNKDLFLDYWYLSLSGLVRY